MNTPQGQRNQGIPPFEAVRRRPWLFLAVAASLLAGTLLIANGLMTPSSLETRVRTEIILLDVDAATPGSLIRPAPVDPERLRYMMSEVAASDGEANEGLHQTDGLRIANDLNINIGDEEGEVVFSMDGSNGRRAIDEANTLISKIVDRLNQQRTGQRDGALAWIETAGAAWQARIDEAKKAIVKNPFDPDLVKIGGRLDDGKLLRSMIDATGKARTEGRDDDVDLDSDITRLNSVLAELEAGRAAQLELGTALRDAEAGLARHDEEAAVLTAKGGILDRPAAVIQKAVSAAPAAGLAMPLQTLGWPVIIPTSAMLSLVLALIAAMAACRLFPSAEVTRNNYLNDPNWPLPPGARREFST